MSGLRWLFSQQSMRVAPKPWTSVHSKKPPKSASQNSSCCYRGNCGSTGTKAFIHGEAATHNRAQSVQSLAATTALGTATEQLRWQSTPSKPAGYYSSTGPAQNSSPYGESGDNKFVGRITQVMGSSALHLSVAGKGPKEYMLSTTRSVMDVDRAELAPASEGFHIWLTKQIRHTIKTTFLPAGYPNTVGEGYLAYCAWNGITNFSITANSVLASTFMLYSVGLGSGAIPTAGALAWVLKDGVGQLGTLLFGKAIAHNFDIHSKTWYFISSIMLKVATGLELATMLAPNCFLLLGSAANSIKGLAWMANGSTRSVFNVSFVRDNNIADITAKGTSQYIFASLLGTAAGAWVAASIGQAMHLAFAAYSLLTVTALWSSYMTVRCIPLPTLNNTRLQLLAEAFLTSICTTSPMHQRHASGNGGSSSSSSSSSRNSSGSQPYMYDWLNCDICTTNPEDSTVTGDVRWGMGHDSSAGTSSSPTDRCYINPRVKYDSVYDDSLEAHVPCPVTLSPLDPPLPGLRLAALGWGQARARELAVSRLLHPRIHVGSRLEHIVEGDPLTLVMLLNTFKYSHFLILPKADGVHIILHDRANARDIIQAYLQACILRRRTKDGPALHTLDLPALRLALTESLSTAERLTTVFMTTLEAHRWTLTKVVVEAEKKRATW